MAFGPFTSDKRVRFALLGVALTLLAGCSAADFPKEQRPVPAFVTAKMSRLGMKETSQIFIRIFKEESQMEIWKERADGEFGLLKTYSICKWSGQLGPKKQEGDRQAPEGFYTVTPGQMNPKSNYYLSFNIGYPNAYDRSLGRTGSNLMVHGACSSAGCYSMTDEDAGEIFALARDSFRGGQTSFQIQAFPFRMTPENLAKHRDDPNMDFWRMLKVGYDTFELTRKPPKVDVCDRRYVFNADAGDAKFSASGACPAYTTPPTLTAALEKKAGEDEVKFTQAVAMLEAKDRAAARAAEPSVVDRLLGGAAPKAASVPATPAPAAKAAPARAANTSVPASVPKPRAAPTVATAAPAPKVVAPKPAAAPVKAAVAEPAKPVVVPPPLPPAVAAIEPPPKPAGTITPDMTPEIPASGTFVKKKFLWPGDEDGETAAQPSG